MPLTALATQVVVPPAAPAPQAAVPPAAPAPRPSDRSESLLSLLRDDRPLSRQKSVHKALVSKFGEKLTFEVPESYKHSDPVAAFHDCADKLIEAVCLAFSGNAAARGYANRMAEEIKLAEREACREGCQGRQGCSEGGLKEGREQGEALRKAENDLASARAEHDRYIKFEDFNSRLVAEYQEGMRDMKAVFTAANPSVVGVDWSFVLAESEETAIEEVQEEGEVSCATNVPEDVVLGSKCALRIENQ
ncbi:hypothetical protein TIFTF001_050008 [Ficus carica]|uniref:Uncharacterized protein n=1 Tax=Ficus carica TaxID=3494 RepID=A0AA87YW66_FICCA|nr:hypothetical protein TIFTF001_050008 [Ficus carica]